MNRIKQVEREYTAIRQAADRLTVEVIRDPKILKSDLMPRDLRIASELLEMTYVIRVFAEFEAGLRRFWSTKRKTRPPTEVLIDRITSMRGVTDEARRKVHAVRVSRNGFVHEGAPPAEAVTIAEVRHRLCHYFRHLPDDW